MSDSINFQEIKDVLSQASIVSNYTILVADEVSNLVIERIIISAVH